MIHDPSAFLSIEFVTKSFSSWSSSPRLNGLGKDWKVSFCLSNRYHDGSNFRDSKPVRRLLNFKETTARKVRHPTFSYTYVRSEVPAIPIHRNDTADAVRAERAEELSNKHQAVPGPSRDHVRKGKLFVIGHIMEETFRNAFLLTTIELTSYHRSARENKHSVATGPCTLYIWRGGPSSPRMTTRLTNPVC